MAEPHFFDNPKIAWPRSMEEYKAMFPDNGPEFKEDLPDPERELSEEEFANSYVEQIPTIKNVLFEKTPKYFPTNYVPGRIKELYTNYSKNSSINHADYLKFLVILCNPAKRAYSDYIHNISELKFPFIRAQLIEDFDDFDDFVDKGLKIIRQKTQLNETFIEEINSANNANAYRKHLSLAMITKGIYYNQMKIWLDHFDLDQFIFLNGDNLIQNPAQEILKFQREMGLRMEITEEDFVYNQETGFYCYKKDVLKSNSDDNMSCLGVTKGRTKGKNIKNKMSLEAESKLIEFYQPYNYKLFDLIGETFEW